MISSIRKIFKCTSFNECLCVSTLITIIVLGINIMINHRNKYKMHSNSPNSSYQNYLLYAIRKKKHQKATPLHNTYLLDVKLHKAYKHMNYLANDVSRIQSINKKLPIVLIARREYKENVPTMTRTFDVQTQFNNIL